MLCFSKKSTAAKTGSAPSAKAASKNTRPIKTPAQYIEAISKRRSIYNLGNKLPQSPKEIADIIQSTIRQCPSSFNVQSSRAVILFGAEHHKVWEIVKAALKKVTTEEQYQQSEAKVDNCFAAGAGTVLFYEDDAAIKEQQESFPSYAESFPTFSQHASGMAQFAVWSALAQGGIGATLQHYNALIEQDLRAAFDLSENWKLVAQMPFGSIEKPADPKTHLPDEGRFIVRGA